MKKIVILITMLSSMSYAMEYQADIDSVIQTVEAFEKFKEVLVQNALPMLDRYTYSTNFQKFLAIARATPDDLEAMCKALDFDHDGDCPTWKTVFNESIPLIIEKLNTLEDVDAKRELFNKALSHAFLSRVSMHKIGASTPDSTIHTYTIDEKNIILQHTNKAVVLLDKQTMKSGVFNNYKDDILCAAVCPDAIYLATAGSNNTITVSNIEEPDKALNGHAQSIISLAWHPNLLCLASISSDGEVKIWDTEKGDCIGSYKTKYTRGNLSWNSDGTYLAIMEKDSEEFIVIDVDKGTIKKILFEKYYNADCDKSFLFWHKSNPYFLFSIAPESDLFIWDIIGKKRVNQKDYEEFIGSYDSPNKLYANSFTAVHEYGVFCFSNINFEIGKYIINEYETYQYGYRDIYDYLPYSEAKIISEPIERVFWHKDSYITINDSVIKIIDQKTNEQKYVFRAGSRINSWNILRNKLIVAEENNKVHILNMDSLENVENVILPITAATTLICSFENVDPHNDYIVIRSDYDLLDIYNAVGTLLHKLKHGEYIYEVLIERDELDKSKIRVLVISQNSIAIWTLDNEHAHLTKSYSIASEKIIKSNISGYWIINKGEVSKFYSDDLAINKSFTMLSTPIYCMAESPDGDVVFGDECGMIHIFNKNGILISSFKAHSLPVVSLCWIDNNALASSSLDTTAKIWTVGGILVDTITGLHSLVNVISGFRQEDTYGDGDKYNTEIKFESPFNPYLSGRCGSNILISKRKPSLNQLYPSYLPYSHAGFLLIAAMDTIETGNILIPSNEIVEISKLVDRISMGMGNQELSDIIKKMIDTVHKMIILEDKNKKASGDQEKLTWRYLKYKYMSADKYDQALNP